MGLILFSLGLNGETLRVWKGNTISDPLVLISLRKLGFVKLDVVSAFFNIYVRFACLVPPKGFSFGCAHTNYIENMKIFDIHKFNDIHSKPRGRQ